MTGVQGKFMHLASLVKHGVILVRMLQAAVGSHTYQKNRKTSRNRKNVARNLARSAAA